MEKRVDQVMKSEVPKRKQTPSIEVTDSGSTLSSPISSPQKASVSQYLVRDESGQRSILSLESKRSLVSMTDYSEASDKTTETSTKPDVEPTARPSVQKQHPGNPSHEASQPSLSEATQQASSDGVASGLSDRSVERPSPEEATSISEQPKYDDEPYDFSKLDFIPKVKLGPRPVAHRKEAKRPAVAGVAAVPAAYRPAQKKQEPIRPRSQAPVNVPARAPTVLPRPPPIPVAPEYSPRPVSRGSVKSMPSHKSAAMTPDKARLMKAVELRRRQLRKSNPQSSHELPPLVVEATAVPTVLEPSDRELAQVAERLAATETELQPDDDHQAIPKKPDSGIELDYEKQQEKLEEGSATEEPKGPPADPTTLARLQPSPSSSRKSLPLDVRRPPSTARSADDADGGAEPTVSLDMLEDSSQPAFPWLLDEQSAESPASEEEIDVETPAEQATDSSTSSRTPSFRPRSPALRQPETYRPTGADRAERQRSNDDTLVPNGTHGSGPGSPRRNHDDLAKRRRGIVEPLHIDPQAEEMTPDEEFLEELHSATVQRATPVNVAKSPMSRDLDRRPSAQSVPSSRSNLSVQSVDIRRSSSVSVEQYDTEAQDGLPGRTRSLTTPYAEKEDSVHGLKRNVSTGISRRIQALAEQSSREVSRSNTPQPTASEAGGIATWRDRKTAVRSPPPPTRSRTGSYRRQSGRSTPVVQQPEPVRNVHHDPLTNRDSVSVSARIVRPGQGQGHDYFGDSSIDAQLHHSQLTVNRKQAPVIAHHQATTPPALNTTITTSSHSPPAAEYRQLHSAARSSLSSRQKQSTLTPATPSADDFPPPPADRNSTTSSTTNDSHATSKSGTRTSRFFKRMSNLGGGGGGGHSRNVSGHSMRLALRSLDMSFPTAPPPPRNGSIVATTSRSGSLAAATDKGDVPPPVVVGDLNIQFPDSLVSLASSLQLLVLRMLTMTRSFGNVVS